MGPALMDDEWIYGSNPEQIFASIAEGRPNGMPSFKYRLSNQQIWQLTAFVRSLSALVPKGARAGRDDHMQVKPAEMQTATAKPKTTLRP
jgi:cytochrome c oxidase cbb3-type subunit 3